MDLPPQMRRSVSIDLGRAMGNNQIGLRQFPPRGLQMQQHNIMGQPYIELRHRGPENRVRFPFGSSAVPGNGDPSIQAEAPPGFMSEQEDGFPVNQGPKTIDPMVNQCSGIANQMSTSMENLHQQPMPMNSGPQHPPLMRSLSHPSSTEALNPPSSIMLPAATVEPAEEIPIPSTDGIEEKLDTDDSAVKDLEDVEVKDLVDDDLENLNLDPEDGKDLDLETNDLHLDDFLTSGKFDIIAYTDPELDLEDKKDMFNEELDLGDPIDDAGEPSDLHNVLSEKNNTSSNSTELPSKVTTEPGTGKSEKTPERSSAQVKQETTSHSHPLCTKKIVKSEVKEGQASAEETPACRGQHDGRIVPHKEGLGDSPRLMETSVQQTLQVSANGLSDSTPVLSRLLIKENLEEAALSSTSSSTQSDLTAQTSEMKGAQQTPNMTMTAAQIPDHAMNPSMAVGHLMNPMQGAPPGNLNVVQGQPSCQAFAGDLPVDSTLALENQQLPGTIAQVQAQQAMFTQGLSQQNQQNRPLLLDEQPLLLQDLLDQERQEQQQQRQMQAMIRQRSSDSFFPNVGKIHERSSFLSTNFIHLEGPCFAAYRKEAPCSPQYVMSVYNGILCEF